MRTNLSMLFYSFTEKFILSSLQLSLIFMEFLPSRIFIPVSTQDHIIGKANSLQVFSGFHIVLFVGGQTRGQCWAGRRGLQISLSDYPHLRN